MASGSRPRARSPSLSLRSPAPRSPCRRRKKKSSVQPALERAQKVPALQHADIPRPPQRSSSASAGSRDTTRRTPPAPVTRQGPACRPSSRSPRPPRLRLRSRWPLPWRSPQSLASSAPPAADHAHAALFLAMWCMSQKTLVTSLHPPVSLPPPHWSSAQLSIIMTGSGRHRGLAGALACRLQAARQLRLDTNSLSAPRSLCLATYILQNV
ncbi:hypothetical protein BDV95DRAFT_187088 [Massariosphaeria phaeospora]|uniref:Uncharacterized protein n=1 Tax=Massariosphaeria phaeospora TaxID=100035 RepID=A0A7C8ME46_9PLEO|nr:hypothetical protein BDV95DRAFT_187088 [Massariosphaeria phaeospora]